MKRFPPISTKCPRLLHGGDYNPDQWRRTPETWDEDTRLMKLAGCNAMTVGVFAWSALEPAPGRYEFGWLDAVMDKLAANGIHVVLATPSGSKPAWLSRAFPEVCRVNADRTRQPHGGRHNHCRTSPVYREKCRLINRALAGRYRDHPALLAWHVSNEYNGADCHCRLCYAAFRAWLRTRYGNDLDRLNHAWWTAFWSHTFSDWEEITPTDEGIHGLMLDWRRFKTDQTIDFFRAESAPLRELTPGIPVTTNFMTGADTLDYWAFARAVDVVSWDSYPRWHETGDDWQEAARTALQHDINRSMKGGRPFMLMESVPSIATRRGRLKKRKKPGMHLLSSLQAVAHGADTVQYFQWRKGRGGVEKFHGAVVDHAGHERTREFRETAAVGRALARLEAVVGTTVPAGAALVQDWENEWALDLGARVYLGENLDYRGECLAHYRPFHAAGVALDVIDQDGPLDGYRLVAAPLAYMLRPGFAARLERFVAAGGTAVVTCWSAVVDQSDCCFLGGVPGGGLGPVFGVVEEETQNYLPGESVAFAVTGDRLPGLAGAFRATGYCSVVRPAGARVEAVFREDYFAGRPALTVNRHGKGEAWYLAGRAGGDFLDAFYRALIRRLSLPRAVDGELPAGVSAVTRTGGRDSYLFLMNFNEHPVLVATGRPRPDLLTGKTLGPAVTLGPYGVAVLAGAGDGSPASGLPSRRGGEG